MEVGISTACLYPLETEAAFHALREAGVHMVELFFNAPSEVEPAFVRTLAEHARAAGVRICAVHPYSSGFEPFMFFSNYRRRFEDALRTYEGFYEAANLLGASLVALHGDRAESHLSTGKYCERLGELSLHAKRHGVVLAQENVAYCRSGSVRFIREVRECLGEAVSFVLDLKQAVRAGVSPLDMLEAMGSRVVHLHLSASRGTGQPCLPPGAGEFPFETLAERLRVLGYTGDGVVELYRDNYGDIAQLVASQKYLQSVLGVPCSCHPRRVVLQ